MKRIHYSIAALFLYVAIPLQAQNNCQNATPLILNNTTITNNDIISETMPSLSPNLEAYSQNTTLYPNVEYIITKGNNSVETANGDFIIIGTSLNGIFRPSDLTRYAQTLSPGDSIRVLAFGYNLNAFQILVDKILNASNGTHACCSYINTNLDLGNLCQHLENNRIYSGTSINNLSKVIDFLDLENTPLTLNNFIAQLENLNNESAVFANGCGDDILPLCYGVDINRFHTYRIYDETIAIKDIANFTNINIYPNPSALGYINIDIIVEKTSDLQFNFYNTLGQLIKVEKAKAIRGESIFTFSTQELAKGLYALEISDGKNNTTQSIIIK